MVAVEVPDLPPSRSSESPQVLLVEQGEGLGLQLREAIARAGYGLMSAASFREAKALLEKTTDVQVAVIDDHLPDDSARRLVETLMQRSPLCRSVVVSTHPQGSQRGAADFARCGAHMYLRQPKNAPELLDAVSRTARSTLEWRQALTPPGPAPTRGLPPTEAPLPVQFELQRAITRLRYVANLSPAETMTAWRVLWGDSNKRIAQLLGCTERTVKFHVAEVLSRTGARSRSGLLRVLLEDAGIRDPWDSRSPADPAGPIDGDE